MVTGQLPMEESESKDMLKKMLVRSFGAIKPIAEHPYAPDEELSRDHREDDEDRPEGPLPDDGRGGRRPRAVPGVARRRRRVRRGRPQAGARTTFASIFALPPRARAGPRRSPPERRRPAKAVPQQSVLCVEAQDEIQDALRKTLTRMGYRALLVGDAERAAERYRESPVDAVIFDADGQGAESIEHFIDMHEKAHEDEHQLVALVLLGPRQGELREKLPDRRQAHRAVQADQDEGRPGCAPPARARRLSSVPRRKGPEFPREGEPPGEPDAE